MRNLDITIVAPQGAGKTTLAHKIFNVMGVTPERVLEIDVSFFRPTDTFVDLLRQDACDAVIFDVPLHFDLHVLAAAVESYRNITMRNVCAVYCIQAKQADFINYKS